MSAKPNLEDFLEDPANLIAEELAKGIDFEAAAASALRNPNSVSSSENGKSDLLATLDDNGASLEAAARRISHALNDYSNKDGMKAAEMIFRANGLLRDKDKDKKEVPEVNITIIGSSGGTNQTLINVLMPK